MRRDPPIASSFGEILNFLRPKFTCDLNWKAFMQFFCKQINNIFCQISEKDHILLIIQIQTSGFAVGRHTALAK
jgi:hypothetical protein